MRYISLSGGGAPASRLCLGTAQFGTGIPPEAAREQLDRFFEKGGSFLDTAHVYGDWGAGERAASERLIGKWLRDRKNRGRIRISTKGGHPVLDGMNRPRLGAGDLRKDLEESLAALGTDFIDLYFLHRDDPALPAAEILGVLEGFRREGKIGLYGCSNWSLGRIIEAEEAAARGGYAGFSHNQVLWGMGDLNRGAVSDPTMVCMDRETFDWHSRTQKPAMAYMAACGGYFAKKLRGLPLAPQMEARYGNPSNGFLLGLLPELERETGATAATLTLAYIMAQDFPAVPIASFSSPAQMDEGLAACDLDFPRDRLEEIRRSRVYRY